MRAREPKPPTVNLGTMYIQHAIDQCQEKIDKLNKWWAKQFSDREVKWISVCERSPNVEEKVIVYTCAGLTTIGNLCVCKEFGIHWQIEKNEDLPSSVTHWMPLPEKPEQK